MQHINIHDAKTHLSRIIEAVCAGDEIVICKAGLPLVQLSPYKQTPQKRKPGSLKGKIKIAKDFDSLPADFKSYFK